MRLSISFFAVMLLTASLLAPYTIARAQNTGTITGVVTDILGGPISGIGLTAWNFETYTTDRSGVAHAGTDKNGAYMLVVPGGTYLVVVDANYYPGSFVTEAYANINSFSRISEATPIKVASGQTVAGVMASSLIAVVYIMPWMLLLSFLRKFKPSTKMIRLVGLVWAGCVVALAVAEVVTSSLLMMATTGAFVLATIVLTTLASTRAIIRHRIP